MVKPESPAAGLRRPRHRAASVLAAVGVALLAFDDVHPLRLIGGGLLASPGWIPLLVAGLLSVRGSGLMQRRLLWWSCSAVGFYAVLLTAITVVIDPGAAYGEQPAEKALRVVGSLLIWLAVLLCGWVLVRQVPRHLLIGLAVMFGIMLVGAVLYRFGVHWVDDLPLIHSGLNAQQRVRSTRFEASSLGGGMLAAVALGTVLLRGRWSRIWCCLAGLVAVLTLTDSRGTELIAAAGIVLLLILQLGAALRLAPGRRAALAVAVIVAALALASSLGIGLIVQSDLWRAAGLSDGARGTSDATRAGWSIVAIQVLATSPLGLGLGSFLHQTPQLLHGAMAALVPGYDANALSELTRFAQGRDDTGVSPKTAPTLAAFYLGWPGVFALGTLWAAGLAEALGTRSADRRSVPAFVAMGCVVFAAAGYSSSLTSWEQALLFGAALGAAGARVVRHRQIPSRGRGLGSGAGRVPAAVASRARTIMGRG